GVMTGRYYLRTGLYNTRFGGDTLGKSEVTIAQLMKKGGYRTGLFGKWHLGQYRGYQPQERGFDEFFGHYHGHIERYQFPDQVFHNGKPVEARGYVSDVFTDAAMDFVEASARKAKRPFFCMLNFNAPHSPWLLDTSHFGQPEGDKLLAKYLERGLPLREARIYSLIERVDVNIGRLLKHIKDLGIEKETLVMFMSDNGGVSKFWKGDMKGNKGQPYEGGVRSPLFARWPGVIKPGGVVQGQVSHVDLLPTCCELAGVDLPADRKIDGQSFVSILRSGKGETHHRYVYHTWDRYFPNPDKRWGVSDQRWKLATLTPKDAKPDPARWQLFDLQSDPGEQTNLAKEHPEVVSRLRKAFTDWFEDVTKGVEYRPIAIPVGHPEEDRVTIQPSWATWTGKQVNYTFDGYDWDTIDGWREPGEKATWRLNVLQPGPYIIQLRYGCRPLDAGGVLRISCGQSSFDYTVRATTTADQFERFRAGELVLKKGEAVLRAEVVSSPGRELMRLNQVYLKRIDP
ncbi:MAG: sulfatase-like hydrolase/transferase, partial [Pirellulaceae bacterium]